jgi:hypothetical protein
MASRSERDVRREQGKKTKSKKMRKRNKSRRKRSCEALARRCMILKWAQRLSISVSTSLPGSAMGLVKNTAGKAEKLHEPKLPYTPELVCIPSLAPWSVRRRNESSKGDKVGRRGSRLERGEQGGRKLRTEGTV